MAIVASILLAFAIGAWWGERERAEAEHVVLQTLLDELRVKQVLLADMSRFSQAIVESAESLLRAAEQPQQKLMEDEIDRLIGDTLWVNNEALWDSAPLNLLVTGGNLALISNPEIVQELAALRVAIGRACNHYQNNDKYYQEVMTPFLIANANLAQISAQMKQRPGAPNSTFELLDLGLSNHTDHRELLQSIQFQNILVAKMERLCDILDTGHPGVEKHLLIVIGLLEDELARKH